MAATRAFAVPRYVFERDADPSHQDLLLVGLVRGPRDGVSVVSLAGRHVEVISTELYSIELPPGVSIEQA